MMKLLFVIIFLVDLRILGESPQKIHRINTGACNVRRNFKVAERNRLFTELLRWISSMKVCSWVRFMIKHSLW